VKRLALVFLTIAAITTIAPQAEAREPEALEFAQDYLRVADTIDDPELAIAVLRGVPQLPTVTASMYCEAKKRGKQPPEASQEVYQFVLLQSGVRRSKPLQAAMLDISGAGIAYAIEIECRL
jgi:hypothetical protein